jgi:hypothetical protein
MKSAELDWLLDASRSDATGFYDAIGVTFRRAGTEEVSVQCFANPDGHSHGDRKASCSINQLTGLWHCKGCGMSGNAYQAALATGRGEVQARELAKRYGLFLEVERKPVKLPYERDLKKWRKALMNSPKIVARLGVVKGWTPQAMIRCGLGWNGERIVFPIRTPKLKIAGVVNYLPGGTPKSKAMPGSKRLLFPAPEVLSRKRPVFVVEGEPDAVSVWSCGHQAVAVPGTGSWRSEWAMRLLGKQVIVLADCDPQGRELAQRIVADVPKARWVDLAPGVDDKSDIGDWVLGASREGGLRQMRELLGRLA